MNNTKPQQIIIRPIIGYPNEAEIGKTYLMTVDVQAALEGVWPYLQEDYALHCILDAEPLFSHQSLGESTIVLNRFGGTYGPATFLLTAATTPQKGAVTVTLVNEQGLPLHQVTLPNIDIVWKARNLLQTVSPKSEISEATPPKQTLLNLPAPNPFFTGREDDLLHLQQQLTSTADTTSLCGIVGLGGVGKSQLALEYAHRNRDNYDFVWWLPADNAQNLLNSYMELGRALNLDNLSGDLTEQAKTVLNWLRQTDNQWLLILDNVDLTPSEITNYLPLSGHGHILVTSRNPVWPSDFHVAELDVFTTEEAIEFLRARLPEECFAIPDNLLEPVIKELKSKEAAEEGKADEIASEELEAERPDLLVQDAIFVFLEHLAIELGYLPFALELAAAYMSANQTDIATYLQLLKKHLQETSAEVEATDGLSSTLNTIWQITFEQLNETDGASPLLSLCSFLASENLPLDAFRKLDSSQIDSALIPVLTDETKWNGALDVLSQTSVFVQTEDAISIHPLVQAMSRDRLKFQEAARWVQICADLLNAIYDLDVYDLRTWRIAGQLLPHLRTITDWAEKYKVEGEAVASLNNTLGLYLRVVVGDYIGARPYYERALTATEKTLGPDHPLTATTLNNQGALLQAVGNYAAARPYLERALAIRERALGPDHPDTAVSLNNLANLLQSMGDYAMARPYYERALAVYEKVLGPDHPEVASSLNNLGLLLQNMGNLAGARPYYERALAIREKALGPDHPEVASSLNNLGLLLQNMGDLAGARPCYERALAIREKTLGPDHPEVASSLNNLGLLLQNMGDSAGVRSYLERALAIREKALVPDHPEIVSSLQNFGAALYTRYTRAGQLVDLEEAIRVYQAAVQRTPPDSPDLPTRLNNLGTGLRARYARTGQLTDLEEAIRVYQTAVQLTPPDSPDLPITLNNLGNGLIARHAHTGQLADLEEAIRVYQTAVQLTPPDSPDLPITLNNLGNGLSDRYGRTGQLADLEEAIRVYQTAMHRTPSDSPDLPTLLNNLGTGLYARYARTGQLADLEEAIRVYQTAVHRTPSDSPDLPARLNNLGTGLRARYGGTGQLADLEEAIRVYQTAVHRTPPDSPDLPARLNNLGTGLRARYARTGQLADLEEAIKAYQDAVVRTPPDSPGLAGYLNNLGNGLRDRYARTSQLADLEEAIRAYQAAVQRTPPDSPDLHSFLNNLGIGLYTRYQHNGQKADLEGSVRLFEEAIQRTPLDSPYLPSYCEKLGDILQERGDDKWSQIYYERALVLYDASHTHDDQHTRRVREKIKLLIDRREKSIEGGKSNIKVHGGIIGGDIVTGDKISIGNVISSGVAIGHGDSANVEQSFPLSKLRNLLERHFNLSELRQLCFHLGIVYADLAGETKDSKIRELIGYSQRHGRVSELIKLCKELRPNVSWE